MNVTGSILNRFSGPFVAEKRIKKTWTGVPMHARTAAQRSGASGMPYPVLFSNQPELVLFWHGFPELGPRFVSFRIIISNKLYYSWNNQ
jgi:hypothetical protein